MSCLGEDDVGTSQPRLVLFEYSNFVEIGYEWSRFYIASESTEADFSAALAILDLWQGTTYTGRSLCNRPTDDVFAN